MKFTCILAALLASAVALRVEPVNEPTYNKADADACKASKGRYKRDGLVGNYYCVHTFKNAFKPCTSSSECEGGCIV